MTIRYSVNDAKKPCIDSGSPRAKRQPGEHPFPYPTRQSDKGIKKSLHNLYGPTGYQQMIDQQREQNLWENESGCSR